MENILIIVIAGLLLFIAIRVSDLHSLFTKKDKVKVSTEELVKTEEPTDDEDYISAKDYVLSTGKASCSSLQTAFRWGYNKAARILNELEQFKVVGPAEQGQRYRKILTKEDLE